ncbi:unnamed protein product [Penicillium olsonii]|uniref:F-box domain-containing protein n=1 Tax=Penicillium olsonii TaxID=99116 RepID=A0A9W4MS00_PENOL|nr:unnamed protein product [Penicillium olsonii]CAG8044061.1 unnamed protein product [Penicillium olsonii]
MAGLPTPIIAYNRHQLLDLPNEILQEVACYLPTDSDVLNLSRSSKEAWCKVFGGDSGVWRARFEVHFDVPPRKKYSELKNEYITRAFVLKAYIDFAVEEDPDQRLWMEVLQTMLQDCLVLPGVFGNSKTLEYLKRVLGQGNFLREPGKPGKPSDLFYGLQLCLSGVALDREVTCCCRRTDYDVETIYSIPKGFLPSNDADDEFADFNGSTSSESTGYGSSVESNELDEPGADVDQVDSNGSETSEHPVSDNKPRPYIDHLDLDLPKLLQIRSFWQRHLLSPSENTYEESYSGLPEILKPGVRKNDISKSSTLSTSWIGYYSCIHPFPRTIEELENRQTCGSHDEEMEIMTLELQTCQDLFWPDVCSQFVAPFKGANVKRVAFKGKQGIHGNVETNHAFGFIEDIEAAYGGFSGWQRVCFTLVERIDDEPLEVKEDAAGWLHIYEAVIIPGGRVMLGRWVDMKAPAATGPFIFWDI